MRTDYQCLLCLHEPEPHPQDLEDEWDLETLTVLGDHGVFVHAE